MPEEARGFGASRGTWLLSVLHLDVPVQDLRGTIRLRFSVEHTMSLSPELVSQVRATLYSAVLSDVLDSLGHTEHAMLPHVRPLDDSLVMFGRARTGLYM